MSIETNVEAQVEEAWVILFTLGERRCGLKIRTAGVDHVPRWESSPEMVGGEKLAFMEAAAGEAHGAQI